MQGNNENNLNKTSSFLVKPTNIYHKEQQEEVVLPTEEVVLTKPVEEKPQEEVVLTKPVEEKPQEEVVLPTEEVVLTKNVEEKPKINPYQIRFNYNKPSGWNKKQKKLNLFQIARKGFLGMGMEPSEQHKFDSVIVADGKALLFVIAIAVTSFYFIFSSNMGFAEKYSEKANKNDDWFNRSINYIVNNYFKDKEPEVNKKTINIVDTTFILNIPEIKPLVDTLVDTLTDATRDATKDVVVDTPVVEVPIQPEIQPEIKPKENKEVIVEPKKGFSKDDLYKRFQKKQKNNE
jgi:hypothetical protein